MDATRDLIWFKLADYYRLSATKQTDPAEKQKAPGLGRRGLSESHRSSRRPRQRQRSAKQAKNLAAYYNNLAEAYCQGEESR